MERKWEELEMDCLVNVFEKLKIEDLILGVPFVCKSWYRASLNPQCWKSLNFSLELKGVLFERLSNEYRIWDFSFTDLIKFALNRGRRSVVELLLPRICSLDNLIYASNKCPCLKILGLPKLIVNCNVKEMEELYELPFLPILSCNYDDIKQFPEPISKWKDLEYVDIGESQFYTDEMLFEIGRHCKNFVGLKISGSIDNENVLAIVNHLPTLKNLTVTSTYMSREHLKMILKACKELENLVLKDCGFEVDEEILKMTSHIKNFEYEVSILDPLDEYFHQVDSEFWLSDI